MAEENKENKEKPEQYVKIIRILSKDIPGNKKIYSGLTLIKGISWSFANAICKSLGLNKNIKIEDLSKEEIRKIEEFIKNSKVPGFLMNRQKDIDSGEDKHLNGSDLDLQKEFDIKKMKKMKSYRGVRHGFGQPVRGQRTKSHFRTKRTNRKKSRAVGVDKKGAKR